MMLHPQGIEGPWRSGIILDWHIIDSVFVGENEFGYSMFDTTRSEIGELLYQFKYRGDQAAFEKLIHATCNYLDKKKEKYDVVIPIPPSSSSRTVTAQIARGLATCLNTQYVQDGVHKVRRTEELKSIYDPDRRREILAGAFQAASDKISGKTVLLVDDLYGSGATFGEATKVVYEQGGASAVDVFAVTRTRVNR